MNTPRYRHPLCLRPQGEAQLPLPHLQETFQGQQVGLAQTPMKSLLLPWVPVYVRPCVHPPRVESLFPPVLRSSCTQAPLNFKAECSGAPPPNAGPLGRRAWLGAQSSHSCGRISVIQLFSSLWVAHPGGMGFDYTSHAPLLPSCPGFFFMSLDVEYLFLVGSDLFYRQLFGS